MILSVVSRYDVALLRHEGDANHTRHSQLFTRSTAQQLFESLHIHGWIFDVELLLLAQKLGIPVAEVPIEWHEIEGSKMSLMRDSINMAIDVLVLRANYTLGRWKPVSTDKRKTE